ncbi:MAG: hypothetical protein M1420_00930 [Actinobacteria bacterium]|jgi:hypothetical protein|nr:hypothetical protein [Actinomycetota bacterium]
MRICHVESLQGKTSAIGRPWIIIFTEDVHRPGLVAGRGVASREVPGTRAASMEFPSSEELRRL